MNKKYIKLSLIALLALAGCTGTNTAGEATEGSDPPVISCSDISLKTGETFDYTNYCTVTASAGDPNVTVSDVNTEYPGNRTVTIKAKDKNGSIAIKNVTVIVTDESDYTIAEPRPYMDGTGDTVTEEQQKTNTANGQTVSGPDSIEEGETVIIQPVDGLDLSETVAQYAEGKCVAYSYYSDGEGIHITCDKKAN